MGHSKQVEITDCAIVKKHNWRGKEQQVHKTQKLHRKMKTEQFETCLNKRMT